MDALDRLAGPASSLLDRVDEVLRRTGAPEGHPVWVPLRRLGVLPGAALSTVAALRPEPLAAPAAVLRETADRYVDTAAALPAAGDWHGAAADRYADRLADLAGHLADGPDSLAGGLRSTADFAEAVARWVGDTRDALAGALGDILVSAQAVTLSGSAGPGAGSGPDTAGSAGGGTAGDPGTGSGTALAVAAADVAVHVLRPVAAAYDHAERLLEDHAGVTVARPYRPGAGPPGAGAFGGVLRVDGGG